MRTMGVIGLLMCAALAAPADAAPAAGDLAPLAAADWTPQAAAHLLERAGFGATPAEVRRLAAMSPRDAVREVVYARDDDAKRLPPFEHSGIFEPGLDPFPASRPAATDAAKATGESMGVKVKPGGPRRLQPVADKFFYWLRASRLETDRVAYWWAHRMLRSRAPLAEKLALFWHGHFATSEEKVRDYRKMLQQLELFQARGRGDFRDLLIGVAQGPAMLAFLDAGVNVKGAPNENFAREIMELFTMGVGEYAEADIREAARAFTGWNSRGLAFTIHADQHDDGIKTLLGRTGRFGGVEAIDIILAQPVSAEYVAGKLYRFFVRDDLSPELQRELGALLRGKRWRIDAFLESVFMSRDFHAAASVGTRIKGPVELVIGTYRKLGLTEVPGLPDFNETTEALGQRLLRPPTVAGWSHGRAWITPGLLIERGNFVQDVMYPHITALASDRYPVHPPGSEIPLVHERIRAGADVAAATQPSAAGGGMDGSAAMSSQGGRDEDFNTRLASYRGWQKAVERVRPIPRSAARLDLAASVRAEGCTDAACAVDRLAARFLSVPLQAAQRAALVDFLTRELGSPALDAAAWTYAEEPLRNLLHALLSLPEYQLH